MKISKNKYTGAYHSLIQHIGNTLALSINNTIKIGIISFCMYTHSLYCQSNVHINGQKTLDLQFGITMKSDYYFVMNYGRNINSSLYYKIGLSIEKGEIGTFDFYEFGLQPRFGYVGLNVNDRLFFNPIGGLYLGYNLNKSPVGENLDEGDLRREYQDNKGFFSYGVSVGLEIEYFLLSRVGLTFGISEYYLLKNPFGNFELNIRGGIKYAF